MKRHSARCGTRPWKSTLNKNIVTGSENHSVTNLIRSCINTNDFSGALNFVLKVEDIGKRRGFLIELKNATFNAGEYQFAIEVTSKIRDDKERNRHFRDMYSRLWHKRSYMFAFDLMLRIIESIDSESVKTDYLDQIVDHCQHESCCLEETEKEDIENKALKMLENMGKKFTRPRKHR